MKQLLRKLVNRETVTYLIFGVLTTGVNYLVFFVLNYLFGEDLALLHNAAAFAAAVLFAFVPNKLWVFESKSWQPAVALREFGAFVGARLTSFGIEELLLWAAKDLLHAGRYLILGLSGLSIAKILISVLTVILNYIFSKLLVFKKRKDGESQ